VEWQLRVYRIKDGELDDWVDEWRAHVAPLRRRFGFEILGPWVDGDTFVWLLGYDGEDGFAAADARYYESGERKGVEPDPARHLASVEQRMLT
jgi:hypothetical protein